MNELSPEELVIEVNKIFKQLPEYLGRLKELGYDVMPKLSCLTSKNTAVSCESAAAAIRQKEWVGLYFIKQHVIG